MDSPTYDVQQSAADAMAGAAGAFLWFAGIVLGCCVLALWWRFRRGQD